MKRLGSDPVVVEQVLRRDGQQAAGDRVHREGQTVEEDLLEK